MIDYTEYIKENVSIIDIVERAGVNLKHNKACCPFHHEKTPSFSVHPKKNIFKCFGCGIGGDVIEFTRMFYNTDFIGAVKILNTEFNLGIEFNNKVSIKSAEKEKYIEKGLNRVINKIYVRRFKSVEMALIAYYRRLHQIIIYYIPPHNMSLCKLKSEYIQALKDIDRIEYYCDIMLYGDFEEKKRLVEMEEVKKIERKYSTKQ